MLLSHRSKVADRLAMQRDVVEAAFTRATDMLLSAIRAVAGTA